MQLEDKLGPLVFTKTYRLIQAWREADDDDDSDARRIEIEQLLETKQSKASFPKIVQLVVADATHYEMTTADDIEDNIEHNDTIIHDLHNSEVVDNAQYQVATEDGDADIEGVTPVSTDVGEANKASDSTDDAAIMSSAPSTSAAMETGDVGNDGDEDIDEEINRGRRSGGRWYSAN